MASSQHSRRFPPIDQLLDRIAELEAQLATAAGRLAQTDAALDDPEYLARRLAKLLADKPDLAATARYVAQVAHDERPVSSLTSMLYRLARVSATVRALRSPRTAGQRAKNIAIGRLLAKAGFWRRLWK